MKGARDQARIPPIRPNSVSRFRFAPQQFVVARQWACSSVDCDPNTVGKTVGWNAPFFRATDTRKARAGRVKVKEVKEMSVEQAKPGTDSPCLAYGYSLPARFIWKLDLLDLLTGAARIADDRN
jgi:hypothetical protein